MLNLWRRKWHWDRFFSDVFGFNLSVLLHIIPPWLHTHILSVKIPSKCEQRYLTGQMHNFILPVPPALLLDDCTYEIAREVLWMNKDFSPAGIIPPWFSILICHLGDEQ
jgi:hypothetical protein